VLASTVADELDEVLTRAFIPPPYILAGHSLGGLYVQAYARSRSRKVAAVLLIDAASHLEPPDTFVSTVLPPAGTTAAAEEAGVPEGMAALRAGPSFPPVPLIVIAAIRRYERVSVCGIWQWRRHSCLLSPRACCIGSRHHQRRLSATTRAPWRSVILAFGHRSHAMR
jgi:pimeloyl-ACP methyl ester carboxylesterase